MRSCISAELSASMGAKLETVNNGPYCFKAHGRKCHHTYDITPNSNNENRYFQLHAVETEEILEVRLRNQAKFECKADILENTDNKLREINPQSSAFKNFG